MNDEPKTLTVRVWRGGEDGAFQTFELPARSGWTVLDVVTRIQRDLDPTLSYRYACRVGMCGSCAMTVNGKPRWTCRTRLETVAGEGELTIEPLKSLPLVKDLATDMEPFFDKWRDAKGNFSPGNGDPDAFAPVTTAEPERRAASAAIECIGCGVCYSACDTVKWRPDYLGPAALNRAWTLVNDSRDGDHAGHLRAVAGESGCLACHSQQSCTQYCPKHLNPTASIAGLKRRAVAAALKGEL